MIEYQFPVVTFYGDNYEDAEITMHSAAIDPKILDHEPYEAALFALDDEYELIWGHCREGLYLCIPNKGFGCTLDYMPDIDENHYALLHANELDAIFYDEATAIAYALNELYKIINVQNERA